MPSPLSARDAAALAETRMEENTPGEDAAAWTSRAAPIIAAIEEEQGPDPMLGRVLSGLYQIEKRIGEGGMGAVYTALHVHLNKHFAIKVLTSATTKSKLAINRLLQEAQTASSIDHPSIVDVVSFDATEDGQVYLVMELLHGISLAEALDSGPMTLTRALPLMTQLCDALGAAHGGQVIHRDLKPENVFLIHRNDEERVKVLDFGISKVKSAEAERVRMTRTGQLVGTPLYMSPEQAKGELEVDHRADIYSLGVLFYEMVVGHPPFEGKNYFQLLWKHGNELPQPPHERTADVPHALSNAIMKALAKAPEDRYQNTADFADALLHARTDGDATGSDALPSSAAPRSLEDKTPMAEGGLDATLTGGRTRAYAAIALVGTLIVGGLLWWNGDKGSENASTAAGSAQNQRDDAVENAAQGAVEPFDSNGTATGAATIAGSPDSIGSPEVGGSAGTMAAEPPATFDVTVVSTPSRARVINAAGETLGTTPLTLSLPTGTHLLTLRRRGYRPRPIQLVVDGPSERAVALTPLPPNAEDGMRPGDDTRPRVRTEL